MTPLGPSDLPQHCHWRRGGLFSVHTSGVIFPLLDLDPDPTHNRMPSRRRPIVIECPKPNRNPVCEG